MPEQMTEVLGGTNFYSQIWRPKPSNNFLRKQKAWSISEGKFNIYQINYIVVQVWEDILLHNEAYGVCTMLKNWASMSEARSYRKIQEDYQLSSLINQCLQDQCSSG